jgi:hypothetical protein
MLTYWGQGAHLLNRPWDAQKVFWKAMPHQMFWPMFISAVLASTVASQALITGAFSIMRQVRSVLFWWTAIAGLCWQCRTMLVLCVCCCCVMLMYGVQAMRSLPAVSAALETHAPAQVRHHGLSSGVL